MALTAANMMGYHTSSTLGERGCPTVFNGLNVAGYIPIVGIFTGSIRIEFAYSSETAHLQVSRSGKVFLVTRGIFEMMGCGTLFLIPDLLATSRVCQVSSASS